MNKSFHHWVSLSRSCEFTMSRHIVMKVLLKRMQNCVNVLVAKLCFSRVPVSCRERQRGTVWTTMYQRLPPREVLGERRPLPSNSFPHRRCDLHPPTYSLGNWRLTEKSGMGTQKIHTFIKKNSKRMKGNLCCAPCRGNSGASSADAIVTNDLWGRRVGSIAVRGGTNWREINISAVQNADTTQ